MKQLLEKQYAQHKSLLQSPYQLLQHQAILLKQAQVDQSTLQMLF